MLHRNGVSKRCHLQQGLHGRLRHGLHHGLRHGLRHRLRHGLQLQHGCLRCPVVANWVHERNGGGVLDLRTKCSGKLMEFLLLAGHEPHHHLILLHELLLACDQRCEECICIWLRSNNGSTTGPSE